MVSQFGNPQAAAGGGDFGPWTDPARIDMVTAEQFAPVNKKLVGDVIGRIITPGAAALELGCGLGHLAKLAPPEYYSNYLQTDWNPSYVEHSVANNPGVPAQVADVYDLSGLEPVIKTGRDGFDIVMAMDFLDTLYDLPRAAQQIASVMHRESGFVHFHNRKPSMGILAMREAESGYIFPYFDVDGRMRRFQLVPRDKYMAAQSSLSETVLCDLVANNPDQMDHFYTDMMPALVSVARDISATLGPDAVVSPTFSQIMHNQAKIALQAAGLEVHFGGAIQGEALVPRNWAVELMPKLKESNANVVSKDANGCISVWEQSLPRDQLLLRNALSVLLATK